MGFVTVRQDGMVHHVMCVPPMRSVRLSHRTISAVVRPLLWWKTRMHGVRPLVMQSITSSRALVSK